MGHDRNEYKIIERGNLVVFALEIGKVDHTGKEKGLRRPLYLSPTRLRLWNSTTGIPLQLGAGLPVVATARVKCLSTGRIRKQARL